MSETLPWENSPFFKLVKLKKKRKIVQVQYTNKRLLQLGNAKFNNNTNIITAVVERNLEWNNKSGETFEDMSTIRSLNPNPLANYSINNKSLG